MRFCYYDPSTYELLLLQDEEEEDGNNSRSPSPDNISMSELPTDTKKFSENRSATAASQEEEFTRSIMDQPGGMEYNISDVAGETIT